MTPSIATIYSRGALPWPMFLHQLDINPFLAAEREHLKAQQVEWRKESVRIRQRLNYKAKGPKPKIDQLRIDILEVLKIGKQTSDEIYHLFPQVKAGLVRGRLLTLHREKVIIRSGPRWCYSYELVLS